MEPNGDDRMLSKSCRELQNIVPTLWTDLYETAFRYKNGPSKQYLSPTLLKLQLASTSSTGAETKQLVGGSVWPVLW